LDDSFSLNKMNLGLRFLKKRTFTKSKISPLRLPKAHTGRNTGQPFTHDPPLTIYDFLVSGFCQPVVDPEPRESPKQPEPGPEQLEPL